MSDVIATDAQMLEQDHLVELFELDLTAFGETVQRFCPGPVDGAPALFNGYTYTSVPVKAEGFKWDGQGTLPSPTLSLSLMDPTLASWVRQFNDMLGAPVRRLRTYRRYLDDGASPDPSALYPIEEYVIERKTNQNSIMVEFELSVSFDQRGKKIPGRQVIRDTCTHTYRTWDGTQFVYTKVTCPYMGSSYFTASGAVALLEGEDVCGKRLSDCEKRFPGQPLPFYGFPGAGRL